MAQTVCVLVSTRDKQRLEAIASDRNRQHKHIERAHVILASAGGGYTRNAIVHGGHLDAGGSR